MSTRPTITISPVTPADYEDVASVYLRSFANTEIMTDIHPPALQPSMERRIGELERFFLFPFSCLLFPLACRLSLANHVLVSLLVSFACVMQP